MGGGVEASNPAPSWYASGAFTYICAAGFEYGTLKLGSCVRFLVTLLLAVFEMCCALDILCGR